MTGHAINIRLNWYLIMPVCILVPSAIVAFNFINYPSMTSTIKKYIEKFVFLDAENWAMGGHHFHIATLQSRLDIFS